MPERAQSREYRHNPTIETGQALCASHLDSYNKANPNGIYTVEVAAGLGRILAEPGIDLGMRLFDLISTSDGPWGMIPPTVRGHLQVSLMERFGPDASIQDAIDTAAAQMLSGGISSERKPGYYFSFLVFTQPDLLLKAREEKPERQVDALGRRVITAAEEMELMRDRIRRLGVENVGDTSF